MFRVQEPRQIVGLCNRMQLNAVLSDRGDAVVVTVPPNRTDILHECDIVGTSLCVNSITI